MPRTKAPDVILCDFETEAIEPRPNYPPKPASLALKWPDRRDWILMSWGHGDGSRAAGNNCTEKEARAEYVKARRSKYPMAFQYAMFDTDVAETHWEVPLPEYDEYEDTMFLLFLWDPHSPTLALKPCAERYLGMKPEEQDRVKEWVLANVPEAKRKPSTWGAYIARCPYQIVKPYHKGDLVRTGGIFDYLWPRVVDAGMREAYEREKKLMPILLRNARVGMRLDVSRLESDLPTLKKGVEIADKWLRRRLGVENVDSDRQLGEALYEKNLLTEYKHTGKSGQISVSKKYLTIDRFRDKKIFHVLQYRNQMQTSISMFAEPWLELASGSVSKDTLYPNWIQVRSSKNGGDKNAGARSNRIICVSPNFLNIPKKWKRSITAGYVHPAFLGNIPQLPYMRTYCLPDKGKRWGRRDANQQEVRIFAHFESDLDDHPVYDGFMQDPRYDMHEDVRAEAEAALIEAALRDSFDRDTAKTTVFGAFYGQGLTGLMESLKLTDEERPVGQIIQRALRRVFPSISALSDALKNLSKQGEPIRTWGGRLYYCEPPAFSEKYGRDMTFEYKLISYLIQGSGADLMKETLVRYDAHPKRDERFVVTVYDETNITLPMSQRGAKEQMGVLKECIESVDLAVPMLSDGEVGPNWGTLEKWKD